MFREIWKDMVAAKQILKSIRERTVYKFKWGTTVEGMSCENPDSLVGEVVVL